MNSIKTTFYDLKNFIILWLSQSLSSLGSAMTNYALVIWSYQQYHTTTICRCYHKFTDTEKILSKS